MMNVDRFARNVEFLLQHHFLLPCSMSFSLAAHDGIEMHGKINPRYKT